MISPIVSSKMSIYLRAFLVFFLVVEFSLLTHVPIPYISVISNPLFLLLLCVFVGFYIQKSIRDRQLPPPFFFLLIPILLIPFTSAYQPKSVFDQPFIYGFLAEKIKFFIPSIPLLTYLLEPERLDIKVIEKLVVSVSLIYFFTALSLYLFVNPEFFSESNFVNLSKVRGPRYNINQALIVSLFLYSIYKSTYELKLKYIPLIVTILFYLLIFVKGRSLLATLFVALLQFFFIKLTWRQKAIVAPVSIIILLFLTAFSHAFYRDELDSLIQLFSSAKNVFREGEFLDGAAALRVSQSIIAWDGIRENLLLGNGFLSHQWNGGFVGQFGRFFPSDIGWLGIF